MKLHDLSNFDLALGALPQTAVGLRAQQRGVLRMQPRVAAPQTGTVTTAQTRGGGAPLAPPMPSAAASITAATTPAGTTLGKKRIVTGTVKVVLAPVLMAPVTNVTGGSTTSQQLLPKLPIAGNTRGETLETATDGGKSTEVQTGNATNTETPTTGAPPRTSEAGPAGGGGGGSSFTKTVESEAEQMKTVGSGTTTPVQVTTLVPQMSQNVKVAIGLGVLALGYVVVRKLRKQ